MKKSAKERVESQEQVECEVVELADAKEWFAVQSSSSRARCSLEEEQTSGAHLGDASVRAGSGLVANLS